MTSTTADFSFLRSREGRFLTALLVFIFVIVVALDQISKRQAHTSLLIFEDPNNSELYQGGRRYVGELGNPDPNAGIPLHIGLQMQYSRNKGAAFSMLANVDDQYRVPFFYIVTLAAVIMIAFYLRSTPLHHWFTRLGLVMILAGAIGNFIDRVHLGYVIDFIDVKWNLFGWKHDFAIFNVADIAINVGVIMLILDMIIHREKKAPKAA